MTARRRKRRPAPELSPPELRQRARRALAKGRAWLAKADDLLREADRRESAANDAALGPTPWPAELCETCKLTPDRCPLHRSRIDTATEPAL